MQRITPDIGTAFQLVEEELRNQFLPALFKGGASYISRRAVTVLPVKQAGIALPDPTHTTGSNWAASCVITGHLVAALRGTGEFWSGDHALLIREGRDKIRRCHTEATDISLGEARAATSTEDALRMGRIMRTGAWVSVLPSAVNGMELGAQEWRNSLFLIYGIDPPELPDYCDGLVSIIIIIIEFLQLQIALFTFFFIYLIIKFNIFFWRVLVHSVILVFRDNKTIELRKREPLFHSNFWFL